MKPLSGTPAADLRFTYDAFISYSRVDSAFAAALERALESFTPPLAVAGRERRRLVVFRDEQDMTGAAYHDAIGEHLRHSQKLIVLCSPSARASPYVDEEIRRFALSRGAEHIVPVLVSGVPNNAAAEAESAQRAFPEALSELIDMPLAVNYAEFVPARDRVSKGRFEAGWYMLLANLLEVSRADIEERDRRRQVRNRNRWIAGLSGAVFVLLVVATWAIWERARAIRRGEITLAASLVATARVPGSLEPRAVEARVLLAVEAVRRLEALHEPTADAASTLRDVVSLLPRRALQLPAGQREVMFSNDGVHGFVAGRRGLRAYNLATGAQVATLDSTRPLHALFASDDGGRIGAVDSSGAITVWAAPTWHRTTALPRTAGFSATCGALSADGALVAALLADTGHARTARLVVWSADSGRQLAQQQVALPDSGVQPAARGECLSLAGDYVLARFATGDTLTRAFSAMAWRWHEQTVSDNPFLRNTAVVDRRVPFTQWHHITDAAWDSAGSSLAIVNASQELENVELAAPPPTAALAAFAPQRLGDVSAVSANGKVLLRVHSSEDPYVPLLRYATFTMLDENSHDERATVAERDAGASLTSSGETLVTFAERRVRLWRTSNGQELMRIGAGIVVHRVVTSLSEQYVALVSDSGAVEIWDDANAAELFRVPGAQVAASSRDGRWIALGGAHGVHVIDVASNTIALSLPLPGPAQWMELTPDGHVLAVAYGSPFAALFGATGGVALIDVPRGVTRAATAAPAAAAKLASDGTALFVAGRDSSVSKFRTADGTVVWRTHLDSGVASTLTVSPDMRSVAVGVAERFGAAHSVQLLSVATGAVSRVIANRSAAAAAFSANGQQLATAGQGAIEIMSADHSAAVRRIALPATLGAVRSLAFVDGDARVAAVIGSMASTGWVRVFTEQAIFLWDLAQNMVNLQRLPDVADSAVDYSATLKEEGKPYFSEAMLGGTGELAAAQVYASRLSYWVLPARRAASELRAWHLAGGRFAEIFRIPGDEFTTLEGLGADNAMLFSSGSNALRVWNTRADGLVAQACKRVTRNLTAAEWAALGPAAGPYRRTCRGV